MSKRKTATDKGAYVAISKPSKGKATFIGDSSPLEDDTPKYMKEAAVLLALEYLLDGFFHQVWDFILPLLIMERIH